MVDTAIAMLRQQGFRGDASSIMIVGDRFDTDIAAGSRSGLRTCLVESGCHAPELQPCYPDFRADYVAASIAELIPPNRRAATASWRPALGAGGFLAGPSGIGDSGGSTGNSHPPHRYQDGRAPIANCCV